MRQDLYNNLFYLIIISEISVKIVTTIFHQTNYIQSIIYLLRLNCSENSILYNFFASRSHFYVILSKNYVLTS